MPDSKSNTTAMPDARPDAPAFDREECRRRRKGKPFVRRLLVLAAIAVAVAGWKIVGKARTLAQFDNTFRYSTQDGFYHTGPTNLKAARGLVDRHGVRVHDYRGQIGRQYSPVAIATFALALVPQQDNDKARRLLFQNLDFLIKDAETTPAGNLVFPYRFDFPACGQQAPWYSGMAQGMATSALLWGYRISGKQKYLTAAKQAVLALLEREYGFLRNLEDGVWLKEFPGYPYAVLDGSLAGIAGIYDLDRMLAGSDPDKTAVRKLLNRCLAGFKANATRFDAPSSGHYFDDNFVLPTPSYHKSNIAWLNYLSVYDPELLEIQHAYQSTSGLAGNAATATHYYVYQMARRVGLVHARTRIR